MKKLKVSIGITAFNEEKNISQLLVAIKKQSTGSDINLVEIIVISDGSNDKTVEVVTSVKDRRIKLFAEKKRLGKNKRINQLFQASAGDVLVLLDADITLQNIGVIDELVKPFVRGKNIGLVAGNAQPLPATTLVAHAVNNFIYALNDMKKRIKNGNNIFSARGPILALSREFTKSLI